MNRKIKKIMLPFILMLIFNLGSYYFMMGENFGEGFSPHVGLLAISGLLFGPYGAIGSVFANILCDLIRGYNLGFASTSGIVSLGVSLLAYKLWYEPIKTRPQVIKPRLNNTSNILLFRNSYSLFTIICPDKQKTVLFNASGNNFHQHADWNQVFY